MARRREKKKRGEPTASPAGAPRIRGGAERAGGQAGGGWVGFGAGLARAGRAEGICNGVRCYFSFSSSSLALRARALVADKRVEPNSSYLARTQITLLALRGKAWARGAGKEARGRSVNSGVRSYLGDMLAAEFASRRRHLC
jgi:hypothetical protein